VARSKRDQSILVVVEKDGSYDNERVGPFVRASGEGIVEILVAFPIIALYLPTRM
jgi:hypothetical protein